MKKNLVLLSLLFCGLAHADTLDIHWLNENVTTYDTTTCSVGGNLSLPPAPTKRGYTFLGWANVLYTPIEYIESTGTQYIDFTGATNIATPIGRITSKAKIALSQNTNQRQFLFSVGSWSVSHYVEVDAGGSFSLGGGSSGNFVHCNVNQIYEIEHTITPSKSTLSIDGIPRLSSSSYQSATDVNLKTIFAIKGNASIVSPYIRVYQYRLYVDDVLKVDLWPVLNANGVACMYDTVSEKLFCNAGTGNFIAGPAFTN